MYSELIGENMKSKKDPKEGFRKPWKRQRTEHVESCSWGKEALHHRWVRRSLYKMLDHVEELQWYAGWVWNQPQKNEIPGGELEESQDEPRK